MKIIRELLMGPAYYWHKQLIRKSKKWSIQEASAYQNARLERLLDHYGSDIKDKFHYRNNIRKYNSLCLPGLTMTVRTGGTTGTPFSFEMDRFFRRQKERAYIFDIWSEIGYEPFDTRLIFRGSTGKKLITYNAIENAWVISPSHLTSESINEIQDFLKKIGPFFLHVYPSSLHTFISLIGVDFFTSLPVRGVFAGSESFPLGQLTSFEKEFNIPVAHWYGHSEYSTLAKYCRECKGFHFYPTYGFTELIPTEDDFCKIIATSFNEVGTKFVRYDTGDIALVGAVPCTAPFHRIKSIVGREQEFFQGKNNDEYAFGPFLFGIHNEFWDKITDIQFIHEVPGVLKVIVVTDKIREINWIEEFLKSRFRMVDLEFIYSDGIQKTTAGKRRYFVNKLDS